MTRLIPVLLAVGTLAGIDYRLDDGSTFERGCFPPCACPSLNAAPVRGTFRLTPTDSNPLFDNYAVTNVDWTVFQATGVPLPIVGAGTFKLGGEVAITEQLSLDLAVGSALAQHFDSGFVVPSVPFPRLDLTISINGIWCIDTVIHVRARPFPKLAVEHDAIGWNPDPPATRYDVIRGDLGMLRETGGDYRVATEGCVANDLAAESVPFPLVPAPGRAFWFLVRTHGGSYDAWDSTLAAPRDGGIELAPAACH